MMIAYQDEGILLQITRRDGYPFHAKSLNIKYHKEGNNNGGGNSDGNNGGNNVGGGSDSNVVISRTATAPFDSP